METNQSSFRIYHSDISLSAPHGTTLMAIRMFADVRLVGFHPPKTLAYYEHFETLNFTCSNLYYLAFYICPITLYREY